MGGVWAQLAEENVKADAKNEIKWKKTVDIDEKFAKTLGKVAKRLYRELELANRNTDMRERLASQLSAIQMSKSLEGKRSKLTSSRRAMETQNETQAFSDSNFEALFRSVLYRSVMLPYSVPTSQTPFKSKSKSKKKKKSTDEEGLDELELEEELDDASGGFVRVAQLLSQLAPEAVSILGSKHSFEFDAKCLPKTSDPSETICTSTTSARFALAGLTCTTAHLSCYAAWFIWDTNASQKVINETIDKANAFLQTEVSHHSTLFASEWVSTASSISKNDSKKQENEENTLVTSIVSVKGSEIEKQIEPFIIFNLWSSDTHKSSLNRQDIINMMKFHEKRLPTDAEVDKLINEISTDPASITRGETFDSWARKTAKKDHYLELRFFVMRFIPDPKQPTIQAKDAKASSSAVSDAVKSSLSSLSSSNLNQAARSSSSSSLGSKLELTGTWTPALMIIDLSDSTASIYSGKAVEKARDPKNAHSTSGFKKSLFGSFSWHGPVVISDGPDPGSIAFGRSESNTLHILKFKDDEVDVARRASQLLTSVHGIGSEKSLSNQLHHSLNMIDITIPALVSIGQPLSI